MSRRDDRELEKAETWDFVQAEVRGPIKASRAVVSVAFRREDLAHVSGYAERIGKRTSQFIREAAIEKASGPNASTLVYGSGGAGSLWWIGHMPVITSALVSLVQEPKETLATTY